MVKTLGLWASDRSGSRVRGRGLSELEEDVAELGED